MKIVSGGQSGVDRAALDIAIAHGLPYGGWCPRGGWAEDFPEPPGVRTRYPELCETPSRDPAKRTRWNVRDSDRTLILVDRSSVAMSEGTALTLRLAERLGKAHLLTDVEGPDSRATVRAWLEGCGPDIVLNVAGPRESTAPGIYRKARTLLGSVLS